MHRVVHVALRLLPFGLLSHCLYCLHGLNPRNFWWPSGKVPALDRRIPGSKPDSTEDPPYDVVTKHPSADVVLKTHGHRITHRV
ncbi:hypothetical protein AVEN_84064-1 [Araneus ventricosus]|uniref:Secreted protein n=1 Tax=Araneus ventricosus TaxID=182803 RepID=A0A4Y2DQ46_ARAVE|nr:hypothetical protein AVEN_22371-1 [Araneus ventricosus]GBM18902.1 hypothetical protein AVEN_84064-1 [Araneus ventricosus]